MKRSSAFAAAALGSALVFSGATGVYATDSSQSSGQGSSVSTSKPELIADAAAARDLDARHVINQTFQDAVLKAKTEFDAAMKVAITAEAKASALAARRFSVSSAIAARQNALTALEKGSKADGSFKPDKQKR
jgi:BMFP domain-containing protein YqiC